MVRAWHSEDSAVRAFTRLLPVVQCMRTVWHGRVCPTILTLLQSVGRSGPSVLARRCRVPLQQPAVDWTDA